jgi:hypothetical protein
MNKLKQFFCNHKELEIKRSHKSCTFYYDVNKILYIDKHDVVNFIACARCGKIFRGRQTQHLYETKEILK